MKLRSAIAFTLLIPNLSFGYDIVFTSSPRPGGDTLISKVPDAAGPLKIEPGTDIRYLKEGESDPTILIPSSKGAIIDPFLSYDKTTLYYVRIFDLSPTGINKTTKYPLEGCQIESINLQTREIKIHVSPDEWSPSEALVTWSKDQLKADPPGTTFPGYKRCHMSPVPLPSGDLFFVSNYANLDIIRGYTELSMQGYIKYLDTGKIKAVWPPPTTILHPIPLSITGEVCFSSLENEQFGKPHRWGVWCINPDGSEFRPLFSATMEGPHTRHFITEFKQKLCTTTYYIDNNAGLGAIICRPLDYYSTFSGPEFGSPTARLNPKIPMGKQPRQWAYTPRGTESLTPSMHTYDRSSDLNPLTGEHYGKAGFPWAASDGILVSYSSGPSNHAMRPTNQPMPQLGIYLIKEGLPVDEDNPLVLVYDDPTRNEFFARSVETSHEIHGINTPSPKPTRPKNDGSVAPYLPPATTKASIGNSSVWRRESCGGQWSKGWECSKPIFSWNEDVDSNRKWQGSDTHKYANSDINGLEIVLQEGVSHFNNGPGASGKIKTRTFEALGQNQRYRILGEVPLYKKDPQGNLLYDKESNPDTSWKALVPCDRSIGFRLVDSEGMALTQPATWHVWACGTEDTRCTGCHTHFMPPLHYKDTIAGQPGFQPIDLTKNTLWSIEYKRDIEMVLERECSACHNPVQKAGNLDLVSTTLVDQLPLKYRVLFNDKNGKLAGPAGYPIYDSMASRYINPFSAAESLFAWIIKGMRLDKRSNDFRPSFTQPGIKPLEADIDYTSEMEQAHIGLTLTEEEQRSIIRWIDLGIPYDLDAKRGWFADEVKPILTHTLTKTQAIIGMRDPESGIEPFTLTIKVNSKPVVSKRLDAERVSITRLSKGQVEVTVKDKAGNIQTHWFQM